MDKVTGNYLTQGNKDFPLDCETLESLQTNIDMVNMLGAICGDRVILYGCEPVSDGSSRREGYVFLRTRAHPGGEVLRFEGGPTSAGMYVKLEDVAVSAQGYDYPKAYTRRSLAAGVGAENYRWEDFSEVPTNIELHAAIKNLKSSMKTELAKLAPAPLGVVQMWAGQRVPDGYALCDGRALAREEYPELYAALGTTFNGATSATGAKYSTGADMFRLPDLRGRFLVGYHDSDDDYKNMGSAGGEKQHMLTTEELPEHKHRVKDYYYPEGMASGNADRVSTNGNIGSADSDADNTNLHYYKHDTETVGGDAAHENRPPYYVLAYIMRIK